MNISSDRNSRPMYLKYSHNLLIEKQTGHYWYWLNPSTSITPSLRFDGEINILIPFCSITPFLSGKSKRKEMPLATIHAHTNTHAHLGVNWQAASPTAAVRITDHNIYQCSKSIIFGKKYVLPFLI